jgi:hypothetical protein
VGTDLEVRQRGDSDKESEAALGRRQESVADVVEEQGIGRVCGTGGRCDVNGSDVGFDRLTVARWQAN